MKKEIILMALILVSFLTMFHIAKATTDTTGGTDTSGDYSIGGANPYINFDKIVASGSGSTSTVGVNIDSCGGSTHIKVAIYSDSGGALPNALLGQSASTSCAAGWNDLTLSGVNIVASTSYWLAIQGDSATITFWVQNTQPRCYKQLSYGTYPDPAATNGCDTNIRVNQRMTYAPAATVIPTIQKPLNNTYVTSSIPFNFSAISSTDSTFTLTAWLNGNVYFNNTAYPNGTWIDNTSTESNGYYNFTVYVQDSVKNNVTSQFFTVYVASAPPASNASSGFSINLPFVMSDPSLEICNDNTTLGITYNFTFAGTFYNYFMNKTCPQGCNQVANKCYGSDSSSSINSMWITFAAGVAFLALGVVLGIPTSDPNQNRRGGSNDIKSRFNTTIVIKYVFFFVGLFFMYLALSMSYSNVNLYGGTSNVLGGINTTTLVMAIIVVLFLFILFIELFFTSIKTMWEAREAKKWSNEEEED